MSNNFSAPPIFESTSDYGARRILGMNGSLMGYIQTGNAYDKHYYHKTPCKDTFVKNDKRKKRKIITGIIAGLGAISAGILLFKKGIIKIPKLQLKNTFGALKRPQNTNSTSKDFLVKCFEDAQKHIEKICSKTS